MEIIVIIIALILFITYLIMPSMDKIRRKRMETYEKQYIAHRGLHNNKSDAPENSLKAFKKAVDAGYGIELDVQLTKDKEVVVVHDSNLKRVAGIDNKICDMTYKELCQVKLFDSDETVPLFKDVLKIIDSKVPIIVEIKAYKEYREVCEEASKLLKDYSGEYCIESFMPLAVRWFKKNYPNVLRGQLSMNYFDKRNKTDINYFYKFAATNLWMNFLCRPDFIAYDIKAGRSIPVLAMSRLFGAKMAAWTIRDEQALKKAEKDYSVIIFDSFIPHN